MHIVYKNDLILDINFIMKCFYFPLEWKRRYRVRKCGYCQKEDLLEVLLFGNFVSNTFFLETILTFEEYTVIDEFRNKLS
jgi:hypothetical protein